MKITRKSLENIGFNYIRTEDVIYSRDNEIKPYSIYIIKYNCDLFILILQDFRKIGGGVLVDIKGYFDIEYNHNDIDKYINNTGYAPDWSVYDIAIDNIEDLKKLLKLLKIPQFM